MMRADEAIAQGESRGRVIGHHPEVWDDNDVSVGGFLGSIVQVAQTCNRMIHSSTCKMCHVYADKQVEYETAREAEYLKRRLMGMDLQQAEASPVERAWIKAAAGLQNHNLEIDLYRQFLFDEGSVGGAALIDEDDDYGVNATTAAIDNFIMLGNGNSPEDAGFLKTPQQQYGGHGCLSLVHPQAARISDDDDGHTVSTQRTN